MHYAEGTVGRTFMVRFDHGENIYDALTAFVRDNNIRAGVVHLMGALQDVRCVAGPKKTALPPDPDWQALPEAREIVGMATIAWTDDVPKLHLHGALGRGTETTLGCLRGEGTVYLTIEATIIEFLGIDAWRVHDAELDIHRLEF